MGGAPIELHMADPRGGLQEGPPEFPPRAGPRAPGAPNRPVWGAGLGAPKSTFLRGIFNDLHVASYNPHSSVSTPRFSVSTPIFGCFIMLSVSSPRFG